MLEKRMARGVEKVRVKKEIDILSPIPHSTPHVRIPAKNRSKVRLEFSVKIKSFPSTAGDDQKSTEN
jgi:hypothetical protein